MLNSSQVVNSNCIHVWGQDIPSRLVLAKFIIWIYDEMISHNSEVAVIDEYKDSQRGMWDEFKPYRREGNESRQVLILADKEPLNVALKLLKDDAAKTGVVETPLR